MTPTSPHSRALRSNLTCAKSTVSQRSTSTYRAALHYALSASWKNSSTDRTVSWLVSTARWWCNGTLLYLITQLTCPASTSKRKKSTAFLGGAPSRRSWMNLLTPRTSVWSDKRASLRQRIPSSSSTRLSRRMLSMRLRLMRCPRLTSSLWWLKTLSSLKSVCTK